ncbi:MAG: translation initiation factor IF-2 subunit gamma [Candidatus Aenigmarchaeota archaeon]|nr:translation initiation factor IF-2 subunit gamma [Candidatus Aenigmarchaeota archaeon]
MIPEVNVGLVGHVAHGKTTLTEALTGKLTLTHSEELKRGITIRLGYADATFYRCTKCLRYCTSEKCPYCFSECEVLRTVSFIDAPGHETLMATVLTATSLMDGALLVIAANEKCPQPQTREHLAALEVAGIKNVVIVQNKIDLVSKERALESYKEIKNFVQGTILEDAPIIPASAQQRANIDLIIQAIEERIPTPKRDEGKSLKMLVARSFDINKPGTEVEKLVGGVLGGSIIQGKLKLGSEIEIKPGIKVGGKYKSLITKVEGLQKAKRNLEEAGPGGLVGILTTLDPFLTKSDSLVGNVVGLPGKLEEAKDSLEIQVKLFERLVGAKELREIAPIKLKEELLINVGTARTIGIVTQLKKDIIEVKLKIPVYAEKSERIVISRQFSGRWRLIGYGNVV